MAWYRSGGGGGSKVVDLVVDETTQVHSLVGNGATINNAYINTAEGYLRVASNGTSNAVTAYFTLTDYIDLTNYSKYVLFASAKSWNSAESSIPPSPFYLILIDENNEVVTPTNSSHYFARYADISSYIGKYKVGIRLDSGLSPVGYGTCYLQVTPSSVFFVA